MRIMQVHNSYQQLGGEDTVFDAEFDILSSNGFAVARYHVSNDGLEIRSGLKAGIDAIWNSGQADQLRRAMEEFEPDVVHVHNTLAVISPAVHHVAKRYGAATVQTLHNYRFICPAATFFRDGEVCEACLGKPIPWPAVKHGCYKGSRRASTAVAGLLGFHRAVGTFRNKIDLYLALTRFARQKFVDGGFPASKIVVKPNFLSVDPGVGHGTGGYALFVGRLSSEKGLETLLTAWEDLGYELPLRIVGDGPLGEHVRTRASRLRGVTALGVLDRKRVSEHMAEATVLIVPSEWYEGLSMVAIEAFAVGLPVIASRIGALEEVVTDGLDGLHFDPGDARSLREAVVAMTSDEVRLSLMRRAARATFEANYSAQVGLDALAAAYERAVQANRSGPAD